MCSSMRWLDTLCLFVMYKQLVVSSSCSQCLLVSHRHIVPLTLQSILCFFPLCVSCVIAYRNVPVSFSHHLWVSHPLWSRLFVLLISLQCLHSTHNPNSLFPSPLPVLWCGWPVCSHSTHVSRWTTADEVNFPEILFICVQNQQRSIRAL